MDSKCIFFPSMVPKNGKYSFFTAFSNELQKEHGIAVLL